MKSSFLATLVLVPAFLASAQTIVSDDFNAYTGVNSGVTPLTSNWSIFAQPNNNSVGSVVNTAGLDGTQALSTSTPSGNEWAVTNRTGFDLSNPVTVSFFYLRGATVGGVAHPQISLVGTVTDSYNAAESVGIRINQASTWQSYRGTGSGGTATAIPAGSITGSAATTQGNWYYFSATFTRISDTEVSVAGSLFDATSSGTVGNLLSSTAPITLASNLGADPTTFALVRANMTQIQSIDNFSVVAVPEPSTYALLAAGLFFAVVVLRRRTQRLG